MKFEDVKNDYQMLIAKYGHPYDMTGGFVDSEAMEKVILDPSKKKAMEYMISVIQYGMQDGINYHGERAGRVWIESDLFLASLYEKYF